MAISFVVIVAALVVLLLARNIAGRRERIIDRLGSAIAASAQPGTETAGDQDINQGIAQAVQNALAEQGLATGNVTFTSRMADVRASGRSLGEADTANLGIGEVLSVSSLSGAPIATVELDSIGEPRRRVMIDLPAESTVARGDRIYVRLNPADAGIATLVLSLAPPTTTNRLDPLVLQPMLLARGEQGQGVVRVAEPLLYPADHAPTAMSSWRLEIEVHPRSGFPFRAEIVTTVSTVEKAARICHVGAEVVVRYDPADLKTITIDGAAMGFAPPAPRAAAIDTSKFAAMSMVDRVKSVREQTGLGLKDAKDLAEGLTNDPAGFAQLTGAPQYGATAPASVDWNRLAGLSKIEKIAAIREQSGVGLRHAKALVEAMEGLGTGTTATDRMTAMLSGRK